MLRLLGLVFLVIICLGTAPWGLVVGAILCLAWFFTSPAPLSKAWADKNRWVTGSDIQQLTAIPLVHAVYCANCDLISNSPHDACGGCGSHSVTAVSRLWQLTFAHAPTNSAKYKISFTADVREIPAAGLSETTKLIGRLAELGGDLKDLHIQVDSVQSDDAMADQGKIELLKPVPRSVSNTWHKIRRQAS